VETDGNITQEGSHLVKSTIVVKHKQQFEIGGVQKKLPSMVSFAKGIKTFTFNFDLK